MRLIDADAYIENNECFGYLDEISVKRFNEITPTIDAVDVVYCKDCRFECGDACLHALGLAAIESPKCYCAYGERKEKTDAEIH